MIYAAYEPINATTLVWDLTAWTKLLQPYQTGHRRELHMYVWSLAILDWAWEQTELRDDGKLEKRQNVCHSEGTHGQVRGNLRSEIWHYPNRTSQELRRQLHPRQTLTQTQFFFFLNNSTTLSHAKLQLFVCVCFENLQVFPELCNKNTNKMLIWRFCCVRIA